jgi:hypothetical protein
MAFVGPTNGYPIGCVNRQTFAGSNPTGKFLYDRGQWASHTNKVLIEPSCVNIAAQGTINWATRKLTLLVEVYYTGSAANPTNKLSVAMIQNEILAFQGSAHFNPTMVVGNLYRHQHMLRDMLTGQWGINVTPTSTGSFFTHFFNYDIPLFVKDTEVALEDLDFIVFVAESEQKIITGIKADITIENLPAVGARIRHLEEIQVYNCTGDADAAVTVKNLGSNPLTSMELTYSIEGGTPKTYTWNKRTIPTWNTDTVHLPVFQVQKNVKQEVKVEVSKVNIQPVTSMPVELSIHKKVPDGDPGMRFLLATDKYANQTTFEISNPDGTSLLKGGPWDTCGWICVSPRYFDFIPNKSGCHRVDVFDSAGDGINNGWGAGYIKIFGALGDEIYYHDGNFKDRTTVMVSVNNAGKVHPITASAGSNGKIFPTGRCYYLEGESAKYDFSVSHKYEVKEIFIDDVSVGMNKAKSYTFPAVDKEYTIHVTFTLATPPVIATDILPNGVLNIEYNQTIDIKSNYTTTCTLESGALPTGLTLDFTGHISGIPTELGKFDFNVKAKDTIGSVNKELSITINELSIGDYSETFYIFPNPTTGELTINNEQLTINNIEIFDVYGRSVSKPETRNPKPETVLDISHLPSGIYFIKIETEKGTVTKKIIKQ